MVDGAFVDEVQIEFAGADFFSVEGFEVGGEVAGVAETMGDGPHAVGKSVSVGAMRAHGVCIGGRLIHAGEKRGAAGCAGGIGRDDVGVTHAFGREPVKVGRANVFLPVATEVVREIFSGEPEDVGSARGGIGGRGGDEQGEGETTNETA